MKLDENLNYIISDECKECCYFTKYSSGPSCVNGIPDEKCSHYKKRLCSSCSYARVSEEHHLLFCKLWECFIEEKGYHRVCESYNIS